MAQLGAVKCHRQRIAHIGHHRKVEQFGGIEFVRQPARVGPVMLVEHAGDRAPLRRLAFRRQDAGLHRVTVGGWQLAVPLGRAFGGGGDALHDGEDDTDQRHQDEQQLDQPDYQAHQLRMPSGELA